MRVPQGIHCANRVRHVHLRVPVISAGPRLQNENSFDALRNFPQGVSAHTHRSADRIARSATH